MCLPNQIKINRFLFGHFHVDLHLLVPFPDLSFWDEYYEDKHHANSESATARRRCAHVENSIKEYSFFANTMWRKWQHLISCCGDEQHLCLELKNPSFWWGHDREKRFITKHQRNRCLKRYIPHFFVALDCTEMQSYSIVRCCPSCLSRLSSSFFGSFYPPGLDAIHYEEHLDYEVLQSTHADLNKAVVRVNLFKEHRQTVQYVEPHDCARLAQVSVQWNADERLMPSRRCSHYCLKVSI